MFTLLDNKAVINSYTAFRQKREKYTVIAKENVCVRYIGSRTTLIPRCSDIDKEDIKPGKTDLFHLLFCRSFV